MDFRIADTFTASLGRLPNAERKLAKTAAFDFQLDPAGTGRRFERVSKSRDANFWSVRVGRDLRMIVHKTGAALLLCYVDHHDAAYAWAERRKIERHPTTGAAQLVEVRQTVRDVEVPRFIEPAGEGVPPTPRRKAKPTRPLEGASETELLGYGVPAEWVADVRAADDDALLDVAAHLPAEAAEAVLKLAVGETPDPPAPAPDHADPYEHPDAHRRFRTVANRDELERAMDAPWERWLVFLHPAQRATVSKSYNGPARVFGSAGTGKTVVALHRAAHLAAANPAATVLLTTFSDPLAEMLAAKLRLLVDAGATGGAGGIAVASVQSVAARLYAESHGAAEVAGEAELRALLQTAAADAGAGGFSAAFLWAEWRDVVDDWGTRSWEAYRDVPRLGRKTRLGERQRRQLWAVFEQVRGALKGRGEITRGDLYAGAADAVARREPPAFDHVIVDEAQDVGVAQLRLLAAMAGGRADGLFFAGDLGQRIFQTPFSWKALGVDVRGRSGGLRVNYRTSHQIRRAADRLLDAEIADVDGHVDGRTGTVSAFDGPEPEVAILPDADAESATVGRWLARRAAEGIGPSEMAVFVRSAAQLPRAAAAVKAAGLKAASGGVTVAQMHGAKGLEFRAVAVMACDDEVLPLQKRVEAVADESDLAEVYATERHLLYVACTRARDCLLLSAAAPESEFLNDLGEPAGAAGRYK